MKSKLKRTIRFNMLLTEDEAKQLQELADNIGLSASDFLRQTVRQQHADWKAAQKK